MTEPQPTQTPGSLLPSRRDAKLHVRCVPRPSGSDRRRRTNGAAVVRIYTQETRQPRQCSDRGGICSRAGCALPPLPLSIACILGVRPECGGDVAPARGLSGLPSDPPPGWLQKGSEAAEAAMLVFGLAAGPILGDLGWCSESCANPLRFEVGDCGGRRARASGRAAVAAMWQVPVSEAERDQRGGQRVVAASSECARQHGPRLRSRGFESGDVAVAA